MNGYYIVYLLNMKLDQYHSRHIAIISQFNPPTPHPML